MAKTAAYAARTPKLSEARTVKQRMIGITTEIKINQP